MWWLIHTGIPSYFMLIKGSHVLILSHWSQYTPHDSMMSITKMWRFQSKRASYAHHQTFSNVNWAFNGVYENVHSKYLNTTLLIDTTCHHIMGYRRVHFCHGNILWSTLLKLLGMLGCLLIEANSWPNRCWLLLHMFVVQVNCINKNEAEEFCCTFIPL